VLFPARDRAWQALTPGFTALVALARTGLPFQVAAQRRYDRSGRVDRLRPALRDGKTVFFPQIHQVLPRVARLMVALRVAFMGAGRDECFPPSELRRHGHASHPRGPRFAAQLVRV